MVWTSTLQSYAKRQIRRGWNWGSLIGKPALEDPAAEDLSPLCPQAESSGARANVALARDSMDIPCSSLDPALLADYMLRGNIRTSNSELTPSRAASLVTGK
jgi:hypothetical protein